MALVFMGTPLRLNWLRCWIDLHFTGNLRCWLRIRRRLRIGCGFENRDGGFSLGFGVCGGCWFVFEDVGEAGGCQGAGLGLDDGLACVGDALDGGDGLAVGFGFEGGGELGERYAVDLAEVERGDGWVGEVFEEGVGEGGDCCGLV